MQFFVRPPMHEELLPLRFFCSDEFSRSPHSPKSTIVNPHSCISPPSLSTCPPLAEEKGPGLPAEGRRFGPQAGDEFLGEGRDGVSKRIAPAPRLIRKASFENLFTPLEGRLFD